MRLNRSMALIASMLLVGCSAMERATLQEEARQLAWNGPGDGPCLFGGVTERAQEHCAFVTSGAEGVLIAISNRIRRHSGAGTCLAYVEAFRRQMTRLKGYRTERVYTCPESSPDGECHVSLAVTSPEGERYVVDNGAVVRDTIGVSGVASFAAFEEAVDGVMWVGKPPTGMQAALRSVHSLEFTEPNRDSD